VWHLKMNKTRSASQHVNQACIPLISFLFFFFFPPPFEGWTRQSEDPAHILSFLVFSDALGKSEGASTFIIYILYYGTDFKKCSARHVILRVFVLSARCSPSITIRYTCVCVFVCVSVCERENLCVCVCACVCVCVCV